MEDVFLITFMLVGVGYVTGWFHRGLRDSHKKTPPDRGVRG
jgi:hypothetical protein